jgi:hypothetical protein
MPTSKEDGLMLHPSLPSLVVACGCALLALSPLGAAASSPADLQVDRLRQVLQDAGYRVGSPVAWGDQALLMEATASGRVVRAFVYTDGQTAAAAHRVAQAQQAGSNSANIPYSDDAGPQLLSGFGASVWRRNVALVQSSPATFAELMPAEADGTDLAAPAGPDLSRPIYRVDPALIRLLDALP